MLAKLPGLHRVQEVELAGEVEPASHRLQFTEAGLAEIVPAAHTTHVLLPVLSACVPGEQGLHLAEPLS